MAITGRITAATQRLVPLVRDIRYQALTALVVVLLVMRLSALPGPALIFAGLAVFAVITAVLHKFTSAGHALVWALVPAVLAAVYSLLQAHSILSHRLPVSEHGGERLIQGHIVALPSFQTSQRGTVARFLFAPADDSLRRIRIAWYQSPVTLRAGQCWELLLRLRSPRGSLNPGAYDYEGWLFLQRIDATAVVRQATRCSSSDQSGLHTIRQSISDSLRDSLEGHRMLPFMLALTLGERSDITDRQWDVLRRTGVAHLLAISGLHIGLIAGFMFLFITQTWRFVPRLSLLLPAPRAAAFAAGAAALGYAALSGFGLPAQRALIMLVIVLMGLLLGEKMQASRLLAIALLIILLIDPFASVTPGFWLSFAAVGWILYAMRARIRQPTAWQTWLWLQLLLGCSLLPLTLFWFGEGSSVSPVVNLVLIPVFFLLVPLILISCLIVFGMRAMDLTAGDHLLALSAQLLDWIWQGLTWVDAGAQPIQLGMPAGWLTVALACLGLLWLFAPKGWPARYTGVILCLPMVGQNISSNVYSTPPASLDVTVLDVGQGLSVVLRTARHVLVYDAGPAYEGGFDAGAMVLVPYLRSLGISKVDRYIESHGDLDHRGGSPALRRELQVMTELGSGGNKPCRKGQSWAWDDVTFDVVHPAAGTWKGNNASCVIKVATGEHAILLTGDIERDAEQALFATNSDISSTVLVVPHHGSATSSGMGLLNHADPELAIVSAGWRNRWGFPKPAVEERFRVRGIRLLNTADSGAITLRISAISGLESVAEQRIAARRFWHAD